MWTFLQRLYLIWHLPELWERDRQEIADEIVQLRLAQRRQAMPTTAQASEQVDAAMRQMLHDEIANRVSGGAKVRMH